MKKKLVLAISGVAAVSILVFGIYYSNATQVATTMTTEEISKMVTSQYPGEITEIEKETEFNRTIYEIELANEEAKYDLKLDGSTGEVLEIQEKEFKGSPEVAQKKEVESVEPKHESPSDSDQLVIKEKESKSDSQNKPSENHKQHEDSNKHKDNKKNQSKSGKKNQSSKHAVISVDEAIKIALNEFPGEVDDVDLEREDGRLIYEIEIERGDKEAEIEIDAYTGEVILIEIDED